MMDQEYPRSGSLLLRISTEKQNSVFLRRNAARHAPNFIKKIN